MSLGRRQNTFEKMPLDMLQHGLRTKSLTWNPLVAWKRNIAPRETCEYSNHVSAIETSPSLHYTQPATEERLDTNIPVPDTWYAFLRSQPRTRTLENVHDAFACAPHI